MTRIRQTLGTQLRHLIELLDDAVEQSYRVSGLAYRPRYTPVVRALMRLDSASIKTITETTGLTHSAISQTIAQMAREGLVATRPGSDARAKIVTLTPAARAMLPAIEEHWQATNAAADGLDRELTTPLTDLLDEALRALTSEPFVDRIDRARAAAYLSRGE